MVAFVSIGFLSLPTRMSEAKGKEPVTDVVPHEEPETIETPYLRKDYIEDTIKKHWEAITDKLKNFHSFMCTEISSVVDPAYMNTYHVAMGQMYEEGVKMMEMRAATVHPLAPRIGFVCFMHKKEIFDAVRAIEEGEPLENIKLPRGLIDDPEKMVAQVPRPLLSKVLRYMHYFVTTMEKIHRLEGLHNEMNFSF